MQLVLTRPDDFHLHVRDGAMLASVIPDTARQFARAIIMPNLKTPVVKTSQALAYRERILASLPTDTSFEPLMTLYLTDNTKPSDIAAARASGYVHAVKYYPAGATTNSEFGVTAMRRAYPAIAAMEAEGMPLLVHGEVTDPAVDIFDREAVFIETVLQPLMDRFQGLRVVMEHITTREAVEFVSAGSERLAATITVHHLLMNRNALFSGGIRPHRYCLPILKHERHRQALVEAATSGNPSFFLGTDSAPHPRSAKESACGCAGMYTAHCAMELYAEVFEEAGALNRLEGFSSHYGADFYGLSRNSESVVLRREAWQMPDTLPLGDDIVVPFRAGEACAWKLEKS